MFKSIAVILILSGLSAQTIEAPALEPDPISIDELERWGLFLGQRSWEQRTAAICGLDGGGFAVSLTDGTIELYRQIKPLGDPSSTVRIALPGVPLSLLQLSGDLFLSGTSTGQLFLLDLATGTRVKEWAKVPGGWQPVGLAHRESNSTILITDQLHGRVWEFDSSTAKPIHFWDGFIEPTATTSAGDRVWVTDRGWHRLIPCYDGEDFPRFDDGIGDHGAAPGLLAGPAGCVGISKRWFFVSDSDNHRIQVIGTHGVSLHFWGLHALEPRESEGRLHYPQSLVLDRNNKVLVVLEPSESRVQIFGPRDAESRPEPAEAWQRVDLISHFGRHWALDRGTPGFLLAVLEPDAERVVILDRRSENPIEIDDVGGHGSKATLFRVPSGIDFMSSSGFPRFVVADRGNRRLQMFEVRRHPDSIVIREAWVTALVRAVDLDQLALDYPDWKGSSPPRPGAVACLESGIIAVVDEASPRILLLDQFFQPLGTLGGPGQLRNPVALAADGDGILVADAGAHRIIRFGLDGSLSTIFSAKPAKDRPVPAGVARHPDGSCYWTDSNFGRLYRTDSSGTTELILGVEDSGSATPTKTAENELYRPGAVQISRDGQVWVVDHGNHRGVVLEPGSSVRHFGSGPYLPQNQRPRQPVEEN
ncbi:MAG: hypothetical protein CBC13_02445 [Planctomycetia bacterium TMED53]|nr:MAG: hypothetical protein CBC13_02445 [Planctomycetia bacterium TMED53]